jgi:hypothetical protein
MALGKTGPFHIKPTIMRRHKVQITVGDRTYLQYWYQKHGTIVIWVRPRIVGAFRSFKLGVFRVKKAHVPIPTNWSFGRPVDFSTDLKKILK